MAKKVSRAVRRERLLHAAAEVAVPATSDVVVVGGGAAGLVAAIAAAEDGASVVVLEKDLECGRPILATGNGRCNFANTCLDPARYNKPDFVEAACGEQWLDDILEFFRECGLRWCAEDDRLYPLSRQASSVRNVLLALARKAGVVLAPARAVESVTWQVIVPSSSADADNSPSAEHVDPDAGPAAPPINRANTLSRHAQGIAAAEGTRSEQAVGIAAAEGACGERVAGIVSFVGPGSEQRQSIQACAVVVASGGMNQQPIAGIDLPVAEGRPVLCPLACQESPLSALDGRRVHAHASLTRAGAHEPCWSECGEVLFRNYGLSGIVIFDASRRAEQGDLIELDLLPELGKDELLELLSPTVDDGSLTGGGSRSHSAATGPIGMTGPAADASAASCVAHADTLAPGSLDGVLDPAIASVLEDLACTRWQIAWPGRAAPATDAQALVALVKALPFIVDGPADADHAQVMRGGLATSAVDPATLAAREQPGLFACGEALDIDADCGGFNLAWAWKSGLVAGAAAARKALS